MRSPDPVAPHPRSAGCGVMVIAVAALMFVVGTTSFLLGTSQTRGGAVFTLVLAAVGLALGAWLMRRARKRRLDQPASAALSSSPVAGACRTCGRPPPAAARFCPICGAPIG